MTKPKLIRITTIPLSLEKLLEGQLSFMQQYYDVTAVAAEEERLSQYGKDNGVETFHLNLTRKITPIKDFLAVVKLYVFLKKTKPTIVHTHTPKAGIVGMMAAWLARVPHRLHTVAGLPLMEATGIKRTILNTVEKLTYYFTTKVYPNSEGLKTFIETENLTHPSKLKIIGTGSSNGIDTTYFDPNLFSETQNEQSRASWKIPETDFVFIFVGRLVADKGINELVKAFSAITTTHKNSTLLLVGPLESELDPLLPETLKLISENPKIVTTDYQKDVRPFFAISNALAFPSYREGFPNVVMQAGAMGLPSIVSNINGCNEIIEEGVNGLIIPKKNDNALQEAMQKLLTDVSLQEKLSNQARKSITSRFERMHMWNAIYKEYQSLS
ncbi:glycosyl transferase, group 1 [unidentified eubacterium SCB49]|nr:glycosyl transferase, group 1 [unidentified eubacterium SCB49]